VVLGLGTLEGFSPDKVRDLSGDLSRYLRRQRLKNVAVISHGGGIGGLEAGAAAEAIAEGTLLGLYRFRRHITAEDEGDLETLTIVEQDASKLRSCRRWKKVCGAVAFWRRRRTSPVIWPMSRPTT
jgi:leucyl aminopeptidase